MNKHHNTGRRNAAKPEAEKKLSWLQVRVNQDKKAQYVRALSDNEKLSEFVIQACDKELEIRNLAK